MKTPLPHEVPRELAGLDPRRPLIRFQKVKKAFGP